MKPDFILTRRNFDRRGFYDLVYEWEDILSEMSEIPMLDEKQYLCNPFFSRVPLLFKMAMGGGRMFYYDMYANIFIERNRNVKNASTCIIDFYVSKKDLGKFERNYDKHNLVYISSREAYEFCKANNCQLSIEHLPLTLSDKYKITKQTTFEKKYDYVIVGRPNRVLAEFLERYKAENSQLSYLEKKVLNGSACFYTNNGDIAFPCADRQSYIEALRQSKIVFYSTPGMDGGESRTKGLSQVTPRFLEAIASGCHVLSRYRENADTDFFELNKMTPNISNYKEFKIEFERALTEKVDMENYSAYMSKHYTSTLIEKFNRD